MIKRIEGKIKRDTKKILKDILPSNKPGFLIVGAQKAGTTSLHYYLSQHPKLVGAPLKEIGFFHKEDVFQKGVKWYHKQFFDAKNIFKKGISFEATPEYLYFEGVPEKIHEYNSEIKIIILLRNPVKRAYSAWNMYSITRSKNRIVKEVVDKLYKGFPSFEECVNNEMESVKLNEPNRGHGVVRRGIYLPQIKKYHELYGKEKVLILGFRELVENKIETLNSILRFLNIPESDWHFLNDEPQNAYSYSQKIDPEIEKNLKVFFEPHNEALFKYLGKEINW